MTTLGPEAGADEIVASAALLAKEYVATLSEVRREAEELGKILAIEGSPGRGGAPAANAAWFRLQALGIRFNTLQPALLDLGRVASQHLEHGRVGDAKQIELRLRLADLESTVAQVDWILNQFAKQFK